jgi:pyruvate dehydrogenase E2 component (dihydrolipoamide acetyltransferase)
MSPPQDRVRISPHARKVARELGIDAQTVQGTGPHGAVTAEDIQRAAAGGKPAGAAPADRMRAAIAAAMARSKREIPHYYLGHTIDLEAPLQWLQRTNEDRPIARRILPVAMLVRAVALGLRAYPRLCGWWRDDAFVPSDAVHIGLAVALRGDAGLVNPAVHDADAGDLSALMEKIRDVTQRARAGQLRSSELSDAAITVTNMGDQGVSTVFGVIHPPQVAIIGFGAVVPRPVVVDDRIVAHRVVDVSLSADHRVTDGHLGARFLRHIDKVLQDPESL